MFNFCIEEEEQLLNEIKKNIKKINVNNHCRTIGAINSRLKIDYKLYLHKLPIEDIIELTSLNYDDVVKSIELEFEK